MNFRGPAAYIGVLFVLITCGLGVPLPEDVPLITGGFLVGRGGSLPLMMFTGLAGILIGDTIIFRAGQVYGEKLLETRLGRHISGDRRAAHHLRLRAPRREIHHGGAVRAGAAGSDVLRGGAHRRALLEVHHSSTALAACISAPAWVYLGWWARKHRMLHKVWAWSAQAQVATLSADCGNRRPLSRRGLAAAALAQAPGAAGEHAAGVSPPGHQGRPGAACRRARSAACDC